MPLYRTEAIVMGGWNLGEADRIISFYARKMGSIRAVAAGCRRVRSKFGGRLQLFTHGALLCFAKENRDLYRINEFEPLDCFQGLRSDLDQLAHASYLIELTSLFTWGSETSEGIFLLLLHGLRGLEKGVEPFHTERAFEIGLLGITGYLPELQTCVRCKRPSVEISKVFLSPQEGGIVCPDCQVRSLSALPLTPPSLAYLQEARRGDLRSLAAVSLSGVERAEILGAMRAYLGSFLQRGLRSLAFMDQMRGDPRRGAD
jgi:DNA repair protein RecO (recombination protein O)